MSSLNTLMTRGIVAPRIHGMLDYPLAAPLSPGPLPRTLDTRAAPAAASFWGVGAPARAGGTAGSPGIARVTPPLLHGYADVAVTSAMIVLPFAAGFSHDTTALLFYLIVG